MDGSWNSKVYKFGQRKFFKQWVFLPDSELKKRGRGMLTVDLKKSFNTLPESESLRNVF